MNISFVSMDLSMLTQLTVSMGLCILTRLTANNEILLVQITFSQFLLSKKPTFFSFKNTFDFNTAYLS